MEGVTRPWKEAYTAQSYDYLREAAIRRDRSVERFIEDQRRNRSESPPEESWGPQLYPTEGRIDRHRSARAIERPSTPDRPIPAQTRPWRTDSPERPTGTLSGVYSDPGPRGRSRQRSGLVERNIFATPQMNRETILGSEEEDEGNESGSTKMEFAAMVGLFPEKDRGETSREYLRRCHVSGDRDNAYWAWIAYDPLGRRLFQQKGHVKGSAQTAEIEAFMKALAWADRKKFRDIKIISDSKYVVEGFDQNLDIWRQTNFQTHKGKELEHMEQWIVISQLAQRKRIWVEHIYSHRPVTDEKGKGNQEVDKLAQLRHAGALLETREG
uniref:RNase H type-1 domain-containing protein n=1 Tax=Periophthalmus magnuspinnatus TaxID=409849 RepID=A0A3B3ZHH1_9GOBI